MTKQKKRFTKLIDGWPVRIKPFLEISNITQKEIAFELGVEPAAVTNYFTYKTVPPLDKFARMLQIVNYPPVYHILFNKGDLDEIRTGMIAQRLMSSMQGKESDDFITEIRNIVGNNTELKNLILFTANVLKNKPDEEGLAELILSSFDQKTVEEVVKVLFSKMVRK